MLPYLSEIQITKEKKNSSNNYSLPFIRYEEDKSEDINPSEGYSVASLPFNFKMNPWGGSSSMKSLSVKVHNFNFSLKKEHTLKELELNFVKIALTNQQQHIFSIIENNISDQLFFDIIQDDYCFQGSEVLIRKFITRIMAWSNYLHSTNRVPFKKLVVHPNLFKIILDFENVINGIDIYYNSNLPKNKIVYLNDSQDHGPCQYVTDGELNDIILANSNLLATIDLLSLSDIREQKINKIFQ